MKDFPGGRFNVEHISCKRTLETVLEMPDCVTGGIAIHHAILTRNDVLEWKGKKRKGINPHNHCRPPAQRFEDRDALAYAILHADEPGYRKISNGPDGAPHLKGDKECDCGCAGLYHPLTGPVIVDFFDRHGKLDRESPSGKVKTDAYKAFTYENGARNFNTDYSVVDVFELEKEEWEVPETYGGIVPFWAGRKLGWKPVDPVALDPKLLEV